MERQEISEWQEIFGNLNDIEPHNDRSSSSSSHGYRLNISAVTNYKTLNVPDIYNCMYQIRLNFYDTVYKQFIGETWKSSLEVLNESASSGSKLRCNKVLYFHTPLADPTVILVVDMVFFRGPKDLLHEQEHIKAPLTFGWGIIRPFTSETPLKGVMTKCTPPLRKMDMFKGTPRALFFMEDTLESNDLLQMHGGCQLAFTIVRHEKMAQVLHLLPEHVFFAPQQCLPAMLKRVGKPLLVDYFNEPRAISHQTCYIDSVQLTLGSTTIEKFELQLCERINNDRLLKDRAEHDGKTVTITERRLMVGVHNGYCYIQKPQFGELELESMTVSGKRSFGQGRKRDSSSVASDVSSCLVLRSRLQLDEFMNDPRLAIVLQIEYLLALPNTNQTKIASSTGPIRYQPFFVSVRWAVWNPFTQDTTSDFVTLNLQGGLSKNPDDVLFYTKRDVLLERVESMGKLRFRFLTSNVNPSFGYSPSTAPSYMPNHSTKPSLPAASPGIEKESIDSLKLQSSTEFNAEITHMKMDGDLSPLHVPSIIPVSSRFPQMTRASHPSMNFTGLPDKLCNPFDVINPNDETIYKDISKCLLDPLQANEIMIQFLAFSIPRPGPGEALHQEISSIFCSFQFYLFQPVTTSRMMLSKQKRMFHDNGINKYTSNLPCLLRKPEDNGISDQSGPGLQIKYFVDPANMNIGENEAFHNYLFSHTLHVDIWNGDSLMLVGSVELPLRCLLRQGRSTVVVDHELDVICSEDTSAFPVIMDNLNCDESMKPFGMRHTLRGKIFMRVGNIGHASEMKAPLEKTISLNAQNNSVVADISGCGFSGGSLSSAKLPKQILVSDRHRRCIAKKMADMSSDLCELLLQNTESGDTSNQGTDDMLRSRDIEIGRNRKINRMLTIRTVGRKKVDRINDNHHALRSMIHKEKKTLKINNLHTVDNFRKEVKANHITELLTLSITTQCTIRPSLGRAHFFEIQLKNPFSKQHTVTIETENPELRVVTDSKEWKYFKSTLNLQTPFEENMFCFNKMNSTPQIYLRPKETVFLPFCYQGFEIGKEVSPGPHHVFTPTETIFQPVKTSSHHGTIKPQVLKAFLRTSDSTALCVLRIHVEPQPHVVDETFRFYNPELSFFKKNLRLPSFKNLTKDGEHSRFHAKCSDREIICQARSTGMNELQHIFIKAPCGQSPSIRRFCLALYNDSFISSPVKIWQFYIHSMQRVDINSVLGQTTRLALVLKGTQSTHNVKCFPSHPQQMEVAPADSFLLPANSVSELTVGIRPIGAPGTTFMCINVVDVEYHQLLRSWLIAVNSKDPIVSKQFEIEIPLLGGKGSMKKITYTNPYSVKKSFQLLTNRPDILTFKELQFELSPGQAYTIGLRFAAGVERAGKYPVHVFIDDNDDKNEEIFLIVVKYV